jgi:hypothetical protein
VGGNDELCFPCTDGRVKHVSAGAICEFLADSCSAEIACRDLVSAANEPGGFDIVTAVVTGFRDILNMPTEPEAESVLEATLVEVDGVRDPGGGLPPKTATTAKKPRE